MHRRGFFSAVGAILAKPPAPPPPPRALHGGVPQCPECLRVLWLGAIPSLLHPRIYPVTCECGWSGEYHLT